MKTLVLTASLFSLAMPVAPIEPQQTLDGTWRARLQDTWVRDDGQQRVSIQLAQGRDRQSGFSVPMTELEGLGARGSGWTASNVQFSIRRDAGSIDFRGDFIDGQGAGTWRFTPNDAFLAELRKTHGDLSLEQVFRLAVHDVSRAFIASMRAEATPRLRSMT